MEMLNLAARMELFLSTTNSSGRLYYVDVYDWIFMDLLFIRALYTETAPHN